MESNFYPLWPCPWTSICLMEMLGWIRSACLETSQTCLTFGSRQSSAFPAKESRRDCWPSRFKCYLLLFPPERIRMNISSYTCSCKGSLRWLHQHSQWFSQFQASFSSNPLSAGEMIYFFLSQRNIFGKRYRKS